MKQYLLVRTDGRIMGTMLLEDPDQGPLPPQASAPTGELLVPYDDEFSFEGRRETEVPFWIDSEVAWVETASLEQLREERRAAINAWKLEANNSYFEFAGKRIAYKESDRVEIQAVNNIVALTGAMPAWADWPAAWKAMDNSWVPLPDVTTWIAFNEAIGQRGTAHFKRAQVLKNELAAATTAAEIEAIQW